MYKNSFVIKPIMLIFHNFCVFFQVLMAFRDIQKEVRLNFNSQNSPAISLSLAPIFTIPYYDVDPDQGFSFTPLSSDFSL